MFDIFIAHFICICVCDMGAHKRICIEFRQFLFVDSSTDECFRCFLARTQFEVESQAHKLYFQDITVDI